MPHHRHCPSSLLSALLLSLLACSSLSPAVSGLSWLSNGDFEGGNVTSWSASPASAASAVVPARLTAFSGNWSMAIAQVYSTSMITQLADLTAVTALQTVSGVPAHTPLTFNYSVAMPLSYGLQWFSSGYSWDSSDTQPCSAVLLDPSSLGKVSEFSSYTCAIPAASSAGSHSLTVSFTARSAYGYFFLDAISLTS